jgi:hypothetical protein
LLPSDLKRATTRHAADHAECARAAFPPGPVKPRQHTLGCPRPVSIATSSPLLPPSGRTAARRRSILREFDRQPTHAAAARAGQLLAGAPEVAVERPPVLQLPPITIGDRAPGDRPPLRCVVTVRHCTSPRWSLNSKPSSAARLSTGHPRTSTPNYRDAVTVAARPSMQPDDRKNSDTSPTPRPRPSLTAPANGGLTWTTTVG